MTLSDLSLSEENKKCSTLDRMTVKQMFVND